MSAKDVVGNSSFDSQQENPTNAHRRCDIMSAKDVVGNSILDSQQENSTNAHRRCGIMAAIQEISAAGKSFRELGDLLEQSSGQVLLRDCLGQRFLGAGTKQLDIKITGIPGNALGAYLNGSSLEVMGNAQDAVGDTMNAGRIVIHGNVGDTAGYAMRGGTILVEGCAGYRSGVHMKEYEDKLPVMVIGGSAGSFLGEYQAGGIILVLGLDASKPIVGNFPCTGMHGGKVFLRSDCRDVLFPAQVTARPAAEEDLELIRPYVEDFCRCFGRDPQKIMDAPFTVVTPDSRNPYRQMYVAN